LLKTETARESSLATRPQREPVGRTHLKHEPYRIDKEVFMYKKNAAIRGTIFAILRVWELLNSIVEYSTTSSIYRIFSAKVNILYPQLLGDY